MGNKIIVMLVEGRRLIGRTDADLKKDTRILLKSACFMSTEVVRKPAEDGERIGVHTTLSPPEGDYQIPMRYAWREANRDEAEYFKHMEMAARAAAAGLSLPSGTGMVGPGGEPIPSSS